MEPAVTLNLTQAFELCREAAARAGARDETARSIARAAVAAEAEGNTAVGLAHFPDYLDALREGRMDGTALPAISQPAPAIILSDARGGSAHLGFDRAFEDLVAAAKTCGVAIFSQRNAYTCGALGYFAARLAGRGQVALAAANGPALMAPPGVARPVYCTNPLAFAAPQTDGPPLVIDQSSSATAFVKLRQAAAAGGAIPDGWAIDAAGAPTTDANAAMRGALLTFGGERGANIALMVEVLAAGVSGANWSLDAPSFSKGAVSPGSGLFVLALDPAVFGSGFGDRLAAQINRLEQHGVYIPGSRKQVVREKAKSDGITIPAALYRRLTGR